MVLLAMTEERTWEVPMADKVEGSGWFQYSEEAWERITRHAEETCLTSCQSATRFALPHERKEVARRINGDTATVFFIYAQTLDPYGDNPDLPPELDQVGREFFAVDPTEGVAVLLYELPTDTQEVLEGKMRVLMPRVGGE